MLWSITWAGQRLRVPQQIFRESSVLVPLGTPADLYHILRELHSHCDS